MYNIWRNNPYSWNNSFLDGTFN